MTKKLIRIILFLVVIVILFRLGESIYIARAQAEDTVAKTSENLLLKEPYLSPPEFEEAKNKFYNKIIRFFVGQNYPILLLALLIFLGLSKRVDPLNNSP